MRKYEVGDTELTVVVHGRGTGTGAWMFPTIDPDERDRALGPHGDASGRISYVYSSAIVRTPEGVTVVDAGFPGTEEREPAVVTALGTVGLAPEDVDTLVITHGHHDHVGGLIDVRGEVVFSRARHFLGAEELAHLAALEPDGPVARVARAGLIETVEGEIAIAPGVRVLPAPGHTPGHVAVEIENAGQRALLVGDAIAHEVNIAEPGWNHFSDMVESPTAESREALVNRAIDGGHLVIASHMPTIGRVTRTGARAVLAPVAGRCSSASSVAAGE